MSNCCSGRIVMNVTSSVRARCLCSVSSYINEEEWFKEDSCSHWIRNQRKGMKSFHLIGRIAELESRIGLGGVSDSFSLGFLTRKHGVLGTHLCHRWGAERSTSRRLMRGRAAGELCRCVSLQSQM